MEVVNEILEQTSCDYPVRTAIIFEDRSVTYHEVEETANQCGGGLPSLEIKEGELVGILMPNGLEFVYAYLLLEIDWRNQGLILWRHLIYKNFPWFLLRRFPLFRLQKW